jgi:hypothetical protein
VFHEGTDSAALEGFAQVEVAVGSLATQRHEQSAWLDLAGIETDSAEGDVYSLWPTFGSSCLDEVLALKHR